MLQGYTFVMLQEQGGCLSDLLVYGTSLFFKSHILLIFFVETIIECLNT